MGLRSYLRGDRYLEGAYAQCDEQRSLPMAENELPLYAPYSATTVTPVEALAIADVWSAVRVLADAASSLPLHVYRKTSSGRQLVTRGKLVDLLDNPAPATTQADLVSTLMAHLLIWGNAYLGKFGQGGQIAQLAPLYPERVRPELDGGRLIWRYSPPSGPQRLLTEADVVHVKGLSVDGILGLSPVTQAANVLGLSDALVKHALSYFDDGSTYPGGTPRPAGVLKLGPDSTSEQGSQMKEGLRNVSRPHGILVVTGEADYIPISQRLDDSQFVEQRRLAAQEIARCFRIPSHMLNAGTGGDSLTYSTAESMSLDFVKFALTPWLRRVELAISSDPDLASQRQFVKFEVDALLRADSTGRAAFYHAALDPVQGWMTRDEVRRLEDLEPEDASSAPPAPASPIQRAIAAMTQPQGVMSNGNQG
jgi:HK97 family phage portal protein